jgi:hypothetical protein
MLALMFLLTLGCFQGDDTDPDPSTKVDDTGETTDDTGDPGDDDRPGRLEGDTEEVDFLETTTGERERRARIIMNTGGTALGLSYTEPGAPFSITGEDGGALPTTLAPGELLRIEIAFEPTLDDSYGASFTITGDDPDSSSVTVALSGEGVLPQPVVQISDRDDASSYASYNLAISDDGYKVVWQDESTRVWYRASTSGDVEPEVVWGPSNTDWGWDMSEDAEVIVSLEDERFYANGVALDNCISHAELDDQCLYGGPFALSADGSHIYFVSTNAWDCEAENPYGDYWRWNCDINGGWNETDSYLWAIPTAGGDPELVAELGDGNIWDLALSRDELSFAYTDSTYNRVAFQREGHDRVTLLNYGLGACEEPSELVMSRDGTTVVVDFECYDRYERWVTAMATDGSWSHEHRVFEFSHDIRLRDIADDGQLFSYEQNSVTQLADTRGCWYQRAVLGDDMNENNQGGIDGWGQQMAFTASRRDADGDWGPHQVWVAEVVLDSAITVNSLGDDPDEALDECACSTGATTDDGEPECTLRAALETAPSWGMPEGDWTRIEFDLPGTEPPTIAISSQLPGLQAWSAIHGETAEAGRVVIDGSGLSGEESGIVLEESDTTVSSLTIQGFPGSGVRVSHDYESFGSVVHDLHLEQNGQYGLYAAGSVMGAGQLSMTDNLGGGAYVGGDALFATDHLEAVGNGGDGVAIQGPGTAWAKNLEARDNAGNGLSASSSLLVTSGVYANNGGYGVLAGEIAAGLIWAEGNCGAGVDASQLTLGGSAYLLDNGVDEGCEDGGLFVSDQLIQAGDHLEVSGNGGPGIEMGFGASATASSLGEGVLVENNAASGIVSGHDLSIGRAEVTGNEGDGLQVSGVLGASYLEVLRNSGTGIAATSLTLDEGTVCDNGGPELEVESSELGADVEICDE